MTTIQELFGTKIVLLDGGMGSLLLDHNLTAQDYGGEQFEGCNEYLCITRPDVIEAIHNAYLDAGADIIETNTFAGSSITLEEFGLQDKTYEISKKAAEIAVQCAQQKSTPEHPRFVAGAIGPTNKTISVTCNVTFEQLEQSYYEQAKALLDGGVDVFLVETVFDTLNAKAAFSALDQLFAEQGKKIPILLSVTIEQTGTMLAGQDIESVYTAMEHHDLLAIGMNCATGPDLMTDHIRTLAQISRFPVLCYPNAGLPLEDGTFPLNPQKFAAFLKGFIDNQWLNVVGGCCGTTPAHIAELRKVVDHANRRAHNASARCAVSGMEPLVIDEDIRPIIVGERTNVIGSRKFKKLICEEEFDVATEIGRAQVRKGAHVIDVCLANTDRNEVEDTIKFFDLITKKVRVPLMIDSTNSIVIEEALKRTQGKCIINSINFEDGLDRINEVMPLVKKYGAAVIFGTIDEDKEQAMATTVERKLEIAKRAHAYLTKEWGYCEHDIIFDPLVFPIATGDEKYSACGKSTIEGIRAIKQALPNTKTVLGISNVSFGLPPAGREVLNSVFLYHCVQAGLDMAIVNSEKLIRYPSIPDEEKKITEDLIFQRVDDPITPFVEFYRGKKQTTEHVEKLPLNERLKIYIIEGRKDGLVEDLDEALKDAAPLDIINGPLIEGMGVVGKLFNENKLIVSEVLQSAESMKAAVAHLEQFMDSSANSTKGKVIIATVKGDVHDIGKNLFHILLKNNCFEVIDLGIKVPPEKLIEAYKEHTPDAIGLSGLLVKSAQMMVTTGEDLKNAGISVPILVGGAALSERFAATKIATAYQNPVLYARDAMSGLDTVNTLVSDYDACIAKNTERQEYVCSQLKEKKEKQYGGTERSAALEVVPPRTVPTLEPQIFESYDLEEIFSYINPQMIYCVHLGFKGNFNKKLAEGDPRAIKLRQQVHEMKEYIIKNNLLKPKALYQFFECNAQQNAIEVYDGETTLETLQFKRQHADDNLCVSDYVCTQEQGRDTFGLFVTTCGDGVIEEAQKLREAGEYLRSHLLQVLALECAEAFAEIIHQKMRADFGIPDKDLSKTDIFQTKYTGIRLSYGYAACPNLDDQKKLFKLLKPERIGVTLSEGMMMEPEASVSAMVFSHPQARYFNL